MLFKEGYAMNIKHILAVFVIVFLFILTGCRGQKKKEIEIEKHREMVRAAGNVIVNQASACINQARVYITVYEYAKVSGMDYEAAAAEMLGKETEQNKRMMMENKRAVR